MRTVQKIKTDMYRFIKGSPLHQAVTGTLTKRGKRPKGSDKEDIVITVPSNLNGQIQIVTVYVNIYVKDDMVNDQAEEASLRLEQLCDLAEALFNEFYGEEFMLTLISQDVIEVSATEEHVISNKIEYKLTNE